MIFSFLLYLLTKQVIEVPAKIIKEDNKNADPIKILIIGKHYCPFTKNAIFLLKENNLPYYYIEATEDKTDFELENYLTNLKKASQFTNLFEDDKFKNSTEYLSALQKKLKYDTVPMIFFDKEFMGGFNELSDMLID